MNERERLAVSRQRTNGSSSEVIVVAPAELWRSIAKSVNRTSRVLAFTTLQELDHWRRTEGFEDPSIYQDRKSTRLNSSH